MVHRGQTFFEQASLVFRNGRRLAALVLFMVAIAALFACGEATEQPEDCLPGEYFNEANESCEACPALTVPQCREGCGFEIINPEDRSDLRCPVAECANPCLCDGGQFFDEETLSCESCEEAIDPPELCEEQDEQEEGS